MITLAIRVNEHNSRRELVDALLEEPSIENVSRCIKEAREFISDNVRTNYFWSNISKVNWSKGGLVTGFKEEQILITNKISRIGDSWEWSYWIEIQGEGSDDEKGSAFIEFTPHEMIEILKKKGHTLPLSGLAKNILKHLKLNPKYATRVELRKPSKGDDESEMETVVVLPPKHISGGLYYTIQIDRDKQTYDVETDGGIVIGGSISSDKEYPAQWQEQ